MLLSPHPQAAGIPLHPAAGEVGKRAGQRTALRRLTRREYAYTLQDPDGHQCLNRGRHNNERIRQACGSKSQQHEVNERFVEQVACAAGPGGQRHVGGGSTGRL